MQQGFVGIATGGDGRYGFLPMRNKRQLSGRVPTDDSLSGFYPRIYRKARPDGITLRSASHTEQQWCLRTLECLWTLQTPHISVWRGPSTRRSGACFLLLQGMVDLVTAGHQHPGIVPKKFPGMLGFPSTPVRIKDDRIFL